MFPLLSSEAISKESNFQKLNFITEHWLSVVSVSDICLFPGCKLVSQPFRKEWLVFSAFVHYLSCADTNYGSCWNIKLNPLRMVVHLVCCLSKICNFFFAIFFFFLISTPLLLILCADRLSVSLFEEPWHLQYDLLSCKQW